MNVEMRKCEFQWDGARIASRQAGVGETVLALHCSGASGAAWERLADRLGPGYRTVAPDLYGYGGSARWPGRGPMTLSAVSGTMLSAATDDTGGIHLVGHSCGGAVALHAALTLGARLRSLALIEPSLFRILRQGKAGDLRLWYEISSLAADVWHGVRAGDLYGAASRFVDYWSGEGAFDLLRPEVQAKLAAEAPVATMDFAMLFSEPAEIESFGGIEAPVLILQGTESMGPSRRICAMLAEAMPTSRLEIVAGAGHMLPFTHAADVNGRIAAHIAAAADDGSMPAAA